jgi:ABC-type phosphate/phosphonate transport system permease subunit
MLGLGSGVVWGHLLAAMLALLLALLLARELGCASAGELGLLLVMPWGPALVNA